MNVYISSDFLMTREDEQDSNLRWFFDLLKRPIELSTGICPAALRSDFFGGATFNRSVFFKKSGISLDIQELQYHYDASSINTDSLQYLKECLGDALVVGYELSEQTRDVLIRADIAYVDIWLHPCRYLDDILFGVSSSKKEVFQALKKYELNEEYLYQYATKYKISTYKGWRRVLDKVSIKPNTALFIGQTLYDKAVAKNGKMLTAIDFIDRLDKASNEYAEVLYSRHPYVKRGDESILEYIKSSSNISLTSYPAYHLLAHPDVKKVLTISSSVACEAKYFEKEVEFLHRPVLELYEKYSTRSYVTIFKSIVNPRFWSEVLSPVIATTSAPNVEYLTSGENLRDMLGFYWSYPEINKLENLRRTVRALDNKVAKIAKTLPQLNKRKSTGSVEGAAASIKASGQQFQAFDIDSIKLSIDKVDFVSFDLFDTLVFRCLEKPGDLIDLFSKQVCEHQLATARSFSKARNISRRNAESSGLKEEVLLRDRYDVLLREEVWSELQTSGKELERGEFALDLKCLSVRPVGKKLFDYALAKGKKVIIVTDTYYPVELIEELLLEFGYKGYFRLFSSSEVGLTKYTGNIFPQVIEALEVSPKAVVHIGDNKISDVEKANLHGVQGIHLPSIEDFFKRSSRLSSKAYLSDEISNSIFKGLLAQRNDSFLTKTISRTVGGGSAIELGYRSVGLFIYGFAKWILGKASEDGVTDLVFLSRDGHVVKDVVDNLLKKTGKAGVKTHYLYASRRSLSVVSIHTLDDALGILKNNFSPVDPVTLLSARYGLDPEVVGPVVRSIFKHQKQVKSASESDIEKLGEVLRLCEKHLLDVAERERAALKEYYSNSSAFDGEKCSIIDIGHNGTLQNYISRFMGIENLKGYYFVTYAGVQSNIIDRGMSASGYLGEFMDINSPEHPYRKNLVMFELAFLSKEQSFVRCKFTSERKVEAEFLPFEGDEVRSGFSANLHQGVVEFCLDLEETICRLGVEFVLEPYESIGPYLELIESPERQDIVMFKEVTFENKYSGRSLEYVVGNGQVPGLWKQANGTLSGSLGQEYDYVNVKTGNGFIRRNFKKMLSDRGQIKKDIINIYSLIVHGEYRR
ncbi:HAD-IA family hydrolase [Microbulbifer sp. MKSA007]|nr:HAD-IA family hydrolase [Microbulbifer sp. MKSA007]